MKTFKFNPVQLSIMLTLQDKFNSSLKADWIDFEQQPERDDVLAIICESGESIEHFGFKWWKKQTPDLAQVKMELVDIWHFFMSEMLRVSYGASKALALSDGGDLDHFPHYQIKEHVFSSVTACITQAKCNHFETEIRGQQTYQFLDHKKSFLFNLLKPVYDEKPVDSSALDSLGSIMNFSFLRSAQDFFACMDSVGMTFEDLFIWYIGKNALNAFRQKNGYKEGTYIKVWNGREDNEYLTDYLSKVSKVDQGFDSETLFDNVLEEMQLKYNSIALPNTKAP
jgi:dimeric dUTPase (all-alpha-NTP-PPase superfamily)